MCPSAVRTRITGIIGNALRDRPYGSVSLLALSACMTSPPSPDPTGQTDADMLRVLTEYQALGAKPITELTVAQTRAQATPGDAAAEVALRAGVPPKMAVANVSDITITGSVGPMSARVDDPKRNAGAAPVILYFHDGGWVTGTLDTSDASCRTLTGLTGAIVVSVQYDLGPKHRFPVAQDDADAAYGWLLNNAASLGGNPHQIALSGESAGGNLAIDTAIWARDKGLPGPRHELMVYPIG